MGGGCGRKYSEDYLKAYCLIILNNTFSLNLQKKDLWYSKALLLDPNLKQIPAIRKGLPI